MAACQYHMRTTDNEARALTSSQWWHFSDLLKIQQWSSEEIGSAAEDMWTLDKYLSGALSSSSVGWSVCVVDILSVELGLRMSSGESDLALKPDDSGGLDTT